MNEKDPTRLQQDILDRLRSVIDPETRVDVVRMHLIENLTVNMSGEVCYTFRPSSPFCPIAVFLVQQIKRAIADVQGVSAQRITITGYVAADELTELINKEN